MKFTLCINVVLPSFRVKPHLSGAAGLTQAELAKRMKTTQGAIARLESGASLPSTRTLKRFAAATGHKLKISFEPSKV